MEESAFSRATLKWPITNILDNVVPGSIRRIYDEASRIKNSSPGSFAVQIRRALEALCKDRGIQKKALEQSLKELAHRGEIPQLLVEMTDVIRLLGNYGAHFDEQTISLKDIFVIEDFFRAVIEYVYVAPSRIDEVKSRLERMRNPPSEADS
jgi:hypothetical protein